MTCALAGAGGVLTAHLWPLGSTAGSLPRFPWPLLAVAAVAVQAIPVRVHVRSQTLRLDLLGVPVVIGAVLVSPRHLLLPLVAANLADGLLGGRPPVRLAFNLVNQLLGMAGSIVALRFVLVGHSPSGPEGWAAIAVGLVCYELLTNAGVAAVMTASDAVPGIDYFRALGVQLAVLLPLSWTLAIVAVSSYAGDRWALLILIGPCLAVAALHRSASRLRESFVGLQHLYGFTMKLQRLSERGEILAVGLSELRSILKCRLVELCVADGADMLCYTIDGSGALLKRRRPTRPLDRELFASRSGRLFAAGESPGLLGTAGYVDCVAEPVGIGSTPAILLAADRDGDGSGTFQPDDLALIGALAAHLGTALTSSARLSRLEREVAAREYEAHHDGLTGLANRTLFSEALATAIREIRPREVVAVILMDLDGFKDVNDTLGHHTGDGLLEEVAARVGSVVGGHLAARLGGDEFAFLMTRSSGLDEITSVASELLRAVSQPAVVEGMVLTLRASIGVATAPLHGVDPEALLRRADVAMYEAKSTGSGIRVYSSEIDHHSPRRLLLAGGLQRAVESGDGLELWYQPVAEVNTASISGFEALLRWNHPDLGAVAPDEFIPIAEQTGLIEPLTWWVLRTALAELRSWRSRGHSMGMAVNISARSLLDSAVVERLLRMVGDHGVQPDHLTLEITESSIMLDHARSGRVLSNLCRAGFHLAIDDFGTGYSSLSRLKDLPIDMVKIDRSFVQNMCVDKRDKAIVRSTIELATVMGYSVVAEGVEDEPTWELLAELGCTHVQGFHLARPMAATSCREWVDRHYRGQLAVVKPISPRAAG